MIILKELCWLKMVKRYFGFIPFWFALDGAVPKLSASTSNCTEKEQPREPSFSL